MSLSMTMVAQEKDGGLFLGVDLSRAVVPFIDTTRMGWQAQADYELLHDMFVAFELGSEMTKFKESNFDYKLNGAYFRLGVDYNFMKHVDEASSDKIVVGLRYGFTSFYHEAENVRVAGVVWNDFTGGVIERKWLVSNWIEICLGMRAHLFNNFYLGWSARIKMMLFDGNDNTMQPYNIPGYGRNNGSNVFGANYTLYYKIPFNLKGNH